MAKLIRRLLLAQGTKVPEEPMMFVNLDVPEMEPAEESRPIDTSEFEKTMEEFIGDTEFVEPEFEKYGFWGRMKQRIGKWWRSLKG